MKSSITSGLRVSRKLVAIQVIDEETAIIDPDWRENDRLRWAAKPADLAL